MSPKYMHKNVLMSPILNSQKLATILKSMKSTIETYTVYILQWNIRQQYEGVSYCYVQKYGLLLKIGVMKYSQIKHKYCLTIYIYIYKLLNINSIKHTQLNVTWDTTISSSLGICREFVPGYPLSKPKLKNAQVLFKMAQYLHTTYTYTRVSQVAQW